MVTIPISEFEHRVAKWAEHLKRAGGRTDIVVLDTQTFEQLKADQERLQALEIKLLIDEGERALARGRFYTHEEVGRRLRRTKPRKP